MAELEKQLQETVHQLLAEGEVELVIGFERGTLPLRTTPCFIRDAEQAYRLVWNASCENNLATYLHQVKGKVGIVAKGCDARSIMGEIVEKQIARETVTIIGVQCRGILDRRKIDQRVDRREVLEADISNARVVLRGAGFEQEIERSALLRDGCITCQHKNPPIYDILVGDPVENPKTADEYAEVEELESQSADERWAYFTREFSRCIRCYACRQACPSCYCPECFVDQSQPTWFGKSDDLSDVMAFHLVRMYHLVGRCLDCGACSRACPMHIDLRRILKKLEKDVRELYAYEAGMDLEASPPLTTFRPDDPQDFIK
jgi:formate dehydrogenase subunit beta